MSIKIEKAKFVIFIIILIVVIFIVRKFNLVQFISPTLIKESVLRYGAAASIVFILIYVAATIFFLPGTPLTIAGGLIFGKFLGTFYTVIGATVGATIAFFVARYMGESFVERILKDKYNKLYEYDKKIESNGLLVVLFLRLVPLFPFNGLNFALGLTKLKRRDFIIGTALGIIPGSFALAFFGESIAELNILKIVAAIFLFILLMLIPVLYKRLKKRK